MTVDAVEALRILRTMDRTVAEALPGRGVGQR